MPLPSERSQWEQVPVASGHPARVVRRADRGAVCLERRLAPRGVGEHRDTAREIRGSRPLARRGRSGVAGPRCRSVAAPTKSPVLPGRPASGSTGRRGVAGALRPAGSTSRPAFPASLPLLRAPCRRSAPLSRVLARRSREDMTRVPKCAGGVEWPPPVRSPTPGRSPDNTAAATTAPGRVSRARSPLPNRRRPVFRSGADRLLGP